MLMLPWWTWLVAGIFLMVSELLFTSGFFLFFFGLGAIITALLAVVLGSTDSPFLNSFVFQGVSFVCISLLCITLLRKPLLARVHFRNQHPPVNSLIGQTAKALEAIAPQATGRVELYGTSWSALNTGHLSIAVDGHCQVHKVEGLTLHVTP